MIPVVLQLPGELLHANIQILPDNNSNIGIISYTAFGNSAFYQVYRLSVQLMESFGSTLALTMINVFSLLKFRALMARKRLLVTYSSISIIEKEERFTKMIITTTFSSIFYRLFEFVVYCIVIYPKRYDVVGSLLLVLALLLRYLEHTLDIVFYFFFDYNMRSLVKCGSVE